MSLIELYRGQDGALYTIERLSENPMFRYRELSKEEIREVIHQLYSNNTKRETKVTIQNVAMNADLRYVSFKGLGDKPNMDTDDKGVKIASETHVGLNTEQLSEKTKQVHGGLKPSSGDLLNKYLYPLINQGIIDKVQSKIDGRQNIYFPVQGGERNNLSALFEDPDNPRLKSINT
jgi:hypothetical protein